VKLCNLKTNKKTPKPKKHTTK